MFLNGGPTCQETCMWYGVPCEPKISSAPIKACYCKPGFIRVYENTDCVPIETPNCQRWIPTAGKLLNQSFGSLIQKGNFFRIVSFSIGGIQGNKRMSDNLCYLRSTM